MNLDYVCSVVDRPPARDSLLEVSRISLAYMRSVSKSTGNDDSFWLTSFEERKFDVHEAAASCNISKLSGILADPIKTDLFYGFDNLAKGITPPSGTGHGSAMGRLLMDLLDATGAKKVLNPSSAKNEKGLIPINDALALLDEQLGTRIDFPNPYDGEVGLLTERGVASYRSLHAIYQSWRIKNLLDAAGGGSVLEIGAGLGRTAYYSWKLGIQDYTCVDIPMTSIAQAGFLGRTIGFQNLVLEGEESRVSAVKILSPASFFKAQRSLAVSLNADSLTEMSLKTAKSYMDYVLSNSIYFVSINHEANSFAAKDLTNVNPIARCPYWLRPGYIEELYIMSHE